MDKQIFLTAAEVGQIVGVSGRTIENWKSAGHIKGCEDGYDLISAVAYRMAKYEKALSKNSQDDKALAKRILVARTIKAEEVARISTADRRIAEIKADQIEGLVMPVDEIRDRVVDVIVKIKTKLLAIPTKLAFELSGMGGEAARIQARLELEVDDTLRELSDCYRVAGINETSDDRANLTAGGIS